MNVILKKIETAVKIKTKGYLVTCKIVLHYLRYLLWSSRLEHSLAL